MPKLFKTLSKKSGLPPGTLVHIGRKRTEKVKIHIIDYDEGSYEDIDAKRIDDCFPFKEKPTTTWINIDGIHQVDIIEKIGNQFNIHPLVCEDIVNTGQRPKMEVFENYLFIVLKMLSYDEKSKEVKSEQVSLIVGANFLISFQEMEGDIFSSVRDRLKDEKRRIRKMGTDYLAYTLMDAIVDNYFLILEKLGESIEEMEDELVSKPTPETLQTIHSLKRELIFLRKSIWPLREVISNLERGESTLINKKTYVFLRDVYDHTIQVIDTVESYRDMVSGMLDIYLSSISNKMNEVMKVLTIMASIFIPMTFLAGIYGMNFEYIPELKWPFGYFAVWGVMALMAILMLIFFKTKKWL